MDRMGLGWCGFAYGLAGAYGLILAQTSPATGGASFPGVSENVSYGLLGMILIAIGAFLRRFLPELTATYVSALGEQRTHDSAERLKEREHDAEQREADRRHHAEQREADRRHHAELLALVREGQRS